MPIVDVRNIPTVVEFAPENKVVEFDEETVTAEVVVGPTVVEFSWGELVPGPGLRGGGVFEGTVHIDQDIPSLPNNSEPIDPEADYLMLWDASSNLHVKVLAQLGAGGIAEIPWATREETDAGVLTDKALNPDVGAYAYDRFRHVGQHSAGKGTATVVVTPSAGSFQIDGSLSNVFRLDMTNNFVLANPINPVNGQTINIHIVQDVAGGHTLTFGNQWKFTNRITPVLTSTAYASDLLSCQWDETDSVMKCSFIPDFGAGYTPPTAPDFVDFAFVNVGGGNNLFRDVVGTDVNFRTIVGDGDIAVSTVGDTIVVGHTSPIVDSVQYIDELLDVDAPAPAIGDTLTWNGTAWVSAQGRKWTLGATWTNGPNALATPVNAVHAYVSEPATLVGWYLLTDSASGSCVVDVRRTPFISYPVDAVDTLCDGVEPTITDAYAANDTDLTGWTTALNEGDVLQFVLESVSGFTTVQIILVLQRDNA